MDPSPDHLVSLVDEISSLTKLYTTNLDGFQKRQAQSALIIKAKQFINQAIDPMEAAIDHMTNVSLFKDSPPFRPRSNSDTMMTELVLCNGHSKGTHGNWRH